MAYLFHTCDSGGFDDARSNRVFLIGYDSLFQADKLARRIRTERTGDKLVQIDTADISTRLNPIINQLLYLMVS